MQSLSLNSGILKRVSKETGMGELKSTGCQTSKKLITLTYLRSLDLADTVTDALNQPKGGEEKETNEDMYMRMATFARDTYNLGPKGIRNCSIAVQCDIKMTQASYRALQRQCIDLKAENEGNEKLIDELNERIDRILGEKKSLIADYKKI